MIKIQTFETLIKKGIKVKQCKKIKMKTKVYLLSLKWNYINSEILIDILIVFQDFHISISIDSIKGQYYYTEHFRREISEIVNDIIKDLSSISEYRFHFFYKKINLNVNPNYLIQNIDKYNKRLKSEDFLEKEANRLLKEVRNELNQVILPKHQNSDVYFKKIILYGYDGIKLSNLLEDLNVVRKTYTKTITFPNAVCEFIWDNIENPKHNREEELIKVWCKILKQYQFSCEILFND